MPKLKDEEEYKMKIESLESQLEVYINLNNRKNTEIDELYKTLEERDDRITKLEQVIVNAAINKYAEVSNV